MKFDLISVIFRLHGLSTVFRNFLKNVKTLEPETYITILSISQVISGRNIKGSIFPTLCHIFSISLGPYGESLLSIYLIYLYIFNHSQQENLLFHYRGIFFQNLDLHTSFSLHLRESRFHNLRQICFWNPASRFEIQNHDTAQQFGIPRTTGIRNTSSSDKENSGIQYLKPGNHSVESRIQDCLVQRGEVFTSRCHGFQISGPQQTVVLQIWQKKKTKKLICMTFLCMIALGNKRQYFSSIDLQCKWPFYSWSQSRNIVEIQKSCYHGNLTSHFFFYFELPLLLQVFCIDSCLWQRLSFNNQSVFYIVMLTKYKRGMGVHDIAKTFTCTIPRISFSNNLETLSVTSACVRPVSLLQTMQCWRTKISRLYALIHSCNDFFGK